MMVADQNVAKFVVGRCGSYGESLRSLLSVFGMEFLSSSLSSKGSVAHALLLERLGRGFWILDGSNACDVGDESVRRGGTSGDPISQMEPRRQARCQ